MDNPTLKQGEIWLDGKPIHPLKSFEAARVGIQLVPEDRRIIGGLTVEENLILSQVAPPIGWPLERIYEHFPRLAERRKQEATTLSGGEQQMLAVARALARELKLLLLDEPYEGLAPVIVQEIERIVAGIKEEGITTDHRGAERHRRAAARRPGGHPRHGGGGVLRRCPPRARQRRAPGELPGGLATRPPESSTPRIPRERKRNKSKMVSTILSGRAVTPTPPATSAPAPAAGRGIRPAVRSG